MQTDLGLEDGLLDPRDLPNNNDHYVFGLCAYQGEEPKFYYYRGVLEDCPVFERSDKGYLYSQETAVQQAVRAAGGTWNISSVHEWRSLITSHIPSRVLAQQVKFHLDGGGDKSAQLHQVETENDESFDQAFFRMVIAPELLASNGELEEDPEDPRESFEELLYAHFSKMASATIKAEQEQKLIKEQEDVVRDLDGLAAIGTKAQEESDKYRLMLGNIAHDGALIQHLVRTDPFPGLLDARYLPSGRVGEIVPYVVIDKIHGLMILDAGLEKLTSVETGILNRSAERSKIARQEVDEFQVVDISWNLVNFKSGNRGGGYTRKAYALDAAIQLLAQLRDIGTAKLAGAADMLQQVFCWVENKADTNSYRKAARQLLVEIDKHQEDIKRRMVEIAQWEFEVNELGDRISKYDQAKGAFEDLIGSGDFSAKELETPILLASIVADELHASDCALREHDIRVGSLEQLFTRYLTFCQNNRGQSVRNCLDTLSVRMDSAKEALQVAKQNLHNSNDEVIRLKTLKLDQEDLHKKNQQQLETLQELQSHHPLYAEWFGETSPETIDIRGNLRQIDYDEKELAHRRKESEELQESIIALLPSVSRFRELFDERDADRINISSELQHIAIQEKALEKSRIVADALHVRIQNLQPFVGAYHRIFGDINPLMLNPSKERAELQQAIIQAETSCKSLDTQVSRLNLFRETNPGWSPTAWLAELESRRMALTQEFAQQNQKVITAQRQLAELMSDPVARPEDVACMHDLLSGTITFVPLHIFIENNCPSDVKQHWLTHFSSLLFAPVVETIGEAAKASRLLYNEQTTMPVLIASPLKAMMESGTPMLVLEEECAYTWLAGIKTRMVHCLLNPEAVKEERSLAHKRLALLKEVLLQKEEELNKLSERSIPTQLARDAERAESSNAEAELLATSQQLTKLRKQLPDILLQSSPEALDSIQKMREYLELTKEHGDNIGEKVVEELRQIVEQIEFWRQKREWYEERNSDAVRQVILDMRRYQVLISKHGVDVLQNIQAELELIRDQGSDLQRSREWFEERDREDIHTAITAMRRYLLEGGEAELAKRQGISETCMAELKALTKKIDEMMQAVAQYEAHHTTAQNAESSAVAAYHQNYQNLLDLADFSEGEGLLFMETHESSRQSLEFDKRKAETRKGYESQFPHAQRYIDESRDGQTSEQDLLKHKADLAIKTAKARLLQENDAHAVDEKNQRLVTINSLRDVLHEAACRLLAEFRSVAKDLEDIRDSGNIKDIQFNNSALFLHAELIRERLKHSDCDPFLIDDIRKLGRLSGELGLAEQSKDIAQVRRNAERVVREYKERKDRFCNDITNGYRKGLSVLNSEWLQSQERFDAPADLKSQIEVSIASNKTLLLQATTSLEFARDKTTDMLTILAKDADRALSILDDAMATTPSARFYVRASVITDDKIDNLLSRLYYDIEAQMRRDTNNSFITEKRQKTRVINELRGEIYRSLFTDVSVEFRHPSIWEGGQHKLSSKSLSEGMRTAISLMWIAKLAEFRLRQAIDLAGGMRRQNNRAALRKERYFVILDGLFSNLSHDTMIDSAMESLRLSAGHFQLIGMIHHPRYINNPKIFPSYFVGRPYHAKGGKHSWLTVESNEEQPGSLGIFGSHFTQ